MKMILLCLLLLCGCQAEHYTMQTYIEETKALFLIESIEGEYELTQPLLASNLVDILMQVSHQEIDYLLSFGCITSEMIEENSVISSSVARKMNQFVYDDWIEKKYVETTFDLGDVIPIEKDVSIETLSPGVYVQEERIFEVSEDGEVKDHELDTFEFKGSFHPDLSTSIQIPEGSSALPSGTSFFEGNDVTYLKSHYFNFNLKDYKVNGKVNKSSVNVNVSKKIENGYTIANELALSDLDFTCDLSLEKQKFYFRVDYQLTNTFSVSKEATVKKNKLTLEDFGVLKEKIASMKGSLPIVEDQLHLLTFQFNVPSTHNLVKITMDLSLKILANGEVELTFKTSNKQGTQTFQNDLNYMNSQKFEIKPYIDGNLECAGVLDFGVDVGNIHIADVGVQGGIGAEASTKIHYVDQEKKLVESTSSTIDYETMSELMNQYNLANKKYVDFCADVNVYSFGRIQANQKNSLLRKLGLYGSVTPIKKNWSILHIENRHVVDACTKAEVLFNPDIEIETFDISNYQLYLTLNNTAQIKATEECTYASSNQEVVRVDENGCIRAVGEGYALIIVTSNDGIERRCLVFVNQ